MSNQLVIYIKDDTKKQLKEISDYNNESMSSVVKKLINRKYQLMLKSKNLKPKGEPISCENTH